MASKRNYLTQEELAEYADITITDTTEADDQISMAEELIDSYVGFQQKSVSTTIEGHATAGSTTTLSLETRHCDVYDRDYLVGCHIEIIGGTGAGKTRRRITGQTREGVITVDSAFDTTPDSTSIYKIWQMGKFPRLCDTYIDNSVNPIRYYKSIPENIKRATASQVEYIIQMGNEYFSGDSSNYTGERIGDYSYTKSDSSGGIANLIAPKTKMLLRGITNRKGVIIV